MPALDKLLRLPQVRRAIERLLIDPPSNRNRYAGGSLDSNILSFHEDPPLPRQRAPKLGSFTRELKRNYSSPFMVDKSSSPPSPAMIQRAIDFSDPYIFYHDRPRLLDLPSDTNIGDILPNWEEWLKSQ